MSLKHGCGLGCLNEFEAYSAAARSRTRNRSDLRGTTVAKALAIADRFLNEIAASFTKIQNGPPLYPPYTKNTRRRVLGSFPFSVIYQDKEEVILIIAIAHAKRREGYWSKRLKQ